MSDIYGMGRTPPADPATALDQQAEGLRRTNVERQERIVTLAKEIAQLSNLSDRDTAFADQYEKAAAELREPRIVVEAIFGNISDLGAR